MQTYDTRNVGVGKTLTASGGVTDGNGGNRDTSAFVQTYDTRNVGVGKTLTASGGVTDGNGGNNYAVTFVPNATGVITTRALTVSAQTDNRVYDGSVASAVSPTITSGTLAPVGGDTSAFVQTYDTRNVGVGKTLTASGGVTDGNGGNNYAVTFVPNATGVITTRALTVSAQTDNRVYDGSVASAVSPTITSGTLAPVGGDTSAFVQTYDTRNVGVGKTLTASGGVTDGNGGNNYAVTFVPNATGVITTRALTVSAQTDNRVYDGSVASAVSPTITSGTLAPVGGDTSAFVQTYDTRNVGVGKTLTASGGVTDGNGGNNYAVTFVPNATGVITTRALTVSAQTDNRVYDGSVASAVSPTITSGTLAPVGGDTSAFVQTYDTRNVGVGKTLTASGGVTDGNGGNNYAVTFVPNATGVITTRALTVSAQTDNRVYDGSVASAVSPTITSGTLAPVGGDTSAFVQTYDTRNVGVGKTLTASGGVTDGNGGNNYAVTFVPNATGVITTRALTVSAQTDNRVYDGSVASAVSPTITSGTLAPVGGDTSAFVQTYDTRNVGVGKTLTASGGVTDGNGGNNYAVTFVPNATGVITTRALTVSAQTDNRVYDGSVASAVSPTITSGTLAPVGGDTSAFVQTYDTRNVGVGKTLTASGGVTDGNGGNNYAVTFVPNATGVITTRALTVSAQTDNRVYDGSVASAVSPTITSGTLAPVGGDTSAFVQTYDTRNVGVGKTLTASGGVTDGNGGNNYAVTFVPNATGVITTRALTVSAQTDNRVYDGSVASAVSPTITSGTLAPVGGDTSAFVQTYDTRNVGVGKTLTASGGVTDGNGGNNYAVTFVPNATGVITTRALTVSAQTDNRVYDGSVASAVSPTITSGTLAPVGGDTSAFVQTYDTRNVGVGKTLTASGGVTDGNGGNNYAVTFVPNATGVITTRALTVSAQTDNRVYDGSVASAVSPTITSGTLAPVGGDTSAFVQTYDTRNVGVGKTLTASGGVTDGNGGNNYAVTFVPNATGVITTRALTVSAQTDNRVYDGSVASAVSPTITSGTLAPVGGDTSAFVQTYDTRNVGVGKTLTASGGVTDGNGGNNYAVTFVPNATGVITTRALTVSAQTDNRVYDGSVASAVSPTITSGTLAPVGGDTSAFVQTYDTRNVGVGKTLTASGGVTDGNGGNNYAVTFVPNATGVITTRALTVSAQTDNRVYDGSVASAVSPTITSGTLAPVGGDTSAFVQTYDTRNVGVGKTLTASGGVTDGNGGNNYAVTFVPNATGVITTRALTVSAQTDNRVYDGSVASAVSPTITSGTLAPVGGDTSAFVQTYDTRNVGVGKTLTASGGVTDGNGGNNYAVTFVPNATGVITTRALTVSAQTDNRVYDGSVASAVSPTITSGTLAPVGGDTSAFVQTYDTRNVGVGKTLTASGGVTDGNGGNNYAVTFVPNATGVITTRALTVSAQTDNRVYDGSVASAVSPTITSGTLAPVGGDTSAFVQTYDTRNVGVGKTLTASGGVTDGNGGNNYAVTFVPNATGVITTRALTVSAQTDNRVYDGSVASAVSPTITSGTLAPVGGDTSAFVQTYDTRNVGVGKTLTASGGVTDGNGGNNYAVTFVPNATGVITTAPLTVTAVTDSRGYNGTTSSGGAPTVGALFSGDTISTAATQSYDTKNVGITKTLTASGLVVSDGNSGNNYAINYVTNATGVITTAPLTVTAVTDSRGYNGTTSSGGAPTVGALFSGDTISTAATQSYDTKNVGITKTLTASGLVVSDGNSGNNYAMTYVPNATGVITAAPLTVTAVTDSRGYNGTTSSGGAPTVGALFSGDTISTAATQSYDTKNVGITKTLTASGLVVSDGNGGNNYAVTFVPNATGVITTAPLTVTAVTDSRGYNGTTSSGGAPTVGALFSGDTISTAATQSYDTKNVGITKTLTASGLVVSDGNSGNNYAINYVTNATGVITAAPLTVTANNQAKTYGQTVTFAGTEFSTSGLQNGETVGSAALASAGAANTAHVAGSPYAITVSSATGGTFTAGNYSITYAPGALTVNQAALTVTANNQTKTYGQTVTFAGTEFTTSALQNGEAVSSVSLASVGAVNTAHVAGSPYAITASSATGAGFTPGDYNINYVPGALTVNPAALTVTANSQAKTYGQTVTFAGTEFTTTALQNGEAVSSVSLVSTGAVNTAHVAGSPYAITASSATGAGFTPGDYNINYVPGALTVNPAALTVTANSQAKTYGQTVTFAGTEFTTAGLKNSETVGSATLTSAGAVNTAQVAGSPYAITASTATGGTFTPSDYTTSYVNGNLTVNLAALAIKANNASRAEGVPNPPFTATYTGFVNSETPAALTGTLVFNTPATIASPAGIYTITPSGQSSTNYSISFINGALTVGTPPSPVVVVVNGLTTGDQFALLQQLGMLNYIKPLPDCAGKAGVVGGAAVKTVVVGATAQCASGGLVEYTAANP